MEESRLKINANFLLSTDEKSTIQDFFESELKAGDSRCKSFVEMFDKEDTARKASSKKTSRFFTLWEQNSNPLPGNWA